MTERDKAMEYQPTTGYEAARKPRHVTRMGSVMHDMGQGFYEICKCDPKPADATISEFTPENMPTVTLNSGARPAPSAQHWYDTARHLAKERERANAQLLELAKILRFEKGDEEGHWFIPAEPQPFGPFFSIPEAAQAFMNFMDDTDKELRDRNASAERKCVELAEELRSISAALWSTNATRAQQITNIARSLLPPHDETHKDYVAENGFCMKCQCVRRHPTFGEKS